MFVLQSSAKQALLLPFMEVKSDTERVTNLPKFTIKLKEANVKPDLIGS